MSSDKSNPRHGSGSSSGEGRSPAMPARSSGKAMKKANVRANDPRLASSSDVANFGEANSAAVVRSAAVARTNPTEYVDPEIPSSSMASASSGEATHSGSIVNLNTPPRPYIHDVYRDSKSAFNREFRIDTPPGYPSRVEGRLHFLDESDDYWRQQEKRCDRHAYEDGFISADEFNRRRQRIRAEEQRRRKLQRQANEADQPTSSNAGSSRAVDAAASETTAFVGTDIGALDFPSVVSSGVTDGTTAPATPASSAIKSPESSTDNILNTGFALSGAEDSSNASVVDSSIKQVADHPSTDSSANSQQSGHESREMSADLMRGSEVLEGEDADNFCAVIRYRPRHQQEQHQHVEANRSMNSTEEDDDEMLDLSISFAQIGITLEEDIVEPMEVDDDATLESSQDSSLSTEFAMQQLVEFLAASEDSTSASSMEGIEFSSVLLVPSVESSQPSTSNESSSMNDDVEDVEMEESVEHMEIDEQVEAESSHLDQPILGTPQHTQNDADLSQIGRESTIASTQSSDSSMMSPMVSIVEPFQPASVESDANHEQGISTEASPSVLPQQAATPVELLPSFEVVQTPASSSESSTMPTREHQPEMEEQANQEVETPKQNELTEKQQSSSRKRVNENVAHHRRRAQMSPTTRFSPHHSVMKRRTITAQRSRLALVCDITRQRNQNTMKIKPYTPVETNPLSDIASHHRRQRELREATQGSLSNDPTVTGQPSRLTMIEARRARTQAATTSTVHRAPSATNTEDTNAITATAAVVEQDTFMAPSPRRELVNKVPNDSAIEKQTVAVNYSGSKVRRIGRPQYTDLERAFARQRQRAPITRQELEVMFALAERSNQTREAAVPATPQRRQSSTSSPTVAQQHRRPFQGRVTRLWLSMKDDGRPVRLAVQRPAPFYSNAESPIRRKQEGEECKARSDAASTENTQRPAVYSVDVEDRPIEEAQTDSESSVASTSQFNSSTDQAGELTSNTVASETPRTHRRYRDSVRRNRARLQYEADSEGEDAHSKSSKKKVNSHKKGLPKCKCTHPEHLKYSCNHAVHDVMKEIARKYLICRWCDLPYARRLITSEDERSDTDDESGNEGHADASQPQVPPAERPATPVEEQEEPDDIVQFEPMSDPEQELDVVERSRPSTPVEASEEHEDIVQFEPMSDPEEGFDVVELPSSRESSQKRRNSTSSSDEDHIPTKRPRRDVYIESSVEGDTDNESHNLPSDNDDDAQQPPPPTIRRARPDPNAPRWGRLTHITELEGINLPDAPRVVNMRDLIVPDNNQLTADLQTLVVSGDNFQAAFYEINGVVVLIGPFNGTVVASKELQEAVNQPIILMNNPHDSIKQIAAGPNHLVMLGKSGRIYTVGCAKDGQLGVAHPEKYRNSSIAPSALLRCVYDEDGNEVTFKTIRVEGNRTVGITEDGSEYSCGHEVGDLFVQTL